VSCEARQYSDQKHCRRCGLTWDMNDPSPPRCRDSKAVGLEWLARIRATLQRPAP